MSGASTLTISRADQDGVEVIRLGGEIDVTNADLVQEAVEATTAEAVVLDLSEVAFLDSIAASTLGGGHRRLEAANRSLYIVCPSDTPPAWTLRVVGMDGGLVCGSLDSALVSAIERHARR